MAALEVLTVDPAAAEAARLTVPQTGDHYDLPRRAEMAFETLTGSAADAALDISGTWNTTGNPALIYGRVTNTASGANAKLLDLGTVAGGSLFSVGKAGNVIAADGSNTAPSFAFSGATNKGFYRSGGVMVFADANADIWWTAASSLTMRSNGYIGFSSGTAAGSPIDTILARDAANTLALRNGTNAQEQRTYGTYTDGSNYRRLTLKMSTSGVAEIKPEGAGTGASGNVIHLSGLPTSNPGPGILWNNGGTPAIGT